jgi:hypothetical protein
VRGGASGPFAADTRETLESNLMPSSTGDPWEDEGFGAGDEWEGKESVEADLEDDEDELELPEEDDELDGDDELDEAE